MANAISSSLSLPALLEERDDGAIVVRGHRVTLFVILEAKHDLESRGKIATPESLEDEFPSISVETFTGILQFCAENPLPIAKYFAEENAIAERNALAHPYTGPSLEELRRKHARP